MKRTPRIRLSAGFLRGRQVPVARGVRPTSSRVREALMDIWSPRLDGARFLDLFAGSGGVGLEALSRGARSVTLVEGDREVAVRLRDFCRELAPDRAEVVELVLPAELSKLRRSAKPPFDLIFADPPYDFEAYPPLIRHSEDLLAPGGEIAAEHPRTVALAERVGSLARFRSRSYGGSGLSFYRRESESESDRE